jgi:hypothetical protein
MRKQRLVSKRGGNFPLLIEETSDFKVAFTMLMRKEGVNERSRDGRRWVECIQLEMVELHVQAVMITTLTSLWLMISG